MNSSRPTVHIPRGFRFSAASCGLKSSGLDVGLIACEGEATAAAVFTTNLVQAAPVRLSRANLRASRHKIRAVIVNSGNANCCTGSDGMAAARATARAVAAKIPGAADSQVLVCSTGVIGARLRVKKILAVIPALVASSDVTPASFTAFSRAIMTTDTTRKWASAKLHLSGREVRLIGCAKGAGMIHPRMATMLAFLATDAAISPPLLQDALRVAVAGSFNSISVDGDTSTNDTVLLLANGASGTPPLTVRTREYQKFSNALAQLCRQLALAIVADGEGAQRIAEIEVRGAASHRAADAIARTIANSPLVKTALAGGDPNWGRILAAAGRAGVPFDPERVSLSLAGIPVYRRGRVLPFDERRAHRRLLAGRVHIVLDIHAGRASARLWTCDLTSTYVRINSSYRS
jgi:glutamate N-acetyltransferase / amino-acid N-acetyltransferase